MGRNVTPRSANSPDTWVVSAKVSSEKVMILSGTARPTGLNSMGSARAVELQVMTTNATEAS